MIDISPQRLQQLALQTQAEIQREGLKHNQAQLAQQYLTTVPKEDQDPIVVANANLLLGKHFAREIG